MVESRHESERSPVHRRKPWRPTAILSVVIAVLAITGAWAFELIGGLEPCPLCITQRVPFYVGIPLAIAGIAISTTQIDWATVFTKVALILFALAMLIGAGYGIYHAGAEWGFWAGPSACGGSGAGAATVGDLIDQLDGAEIIRCDEAAIRVLGLSLAGWNVVVSVLVAFLALRAWRLMPRGF